MKSVKIMALATLVCTSGQMLGMFGGFTKRLGAVWAAAGSRFGSQGFSSRALSRSPWIQKATFGGLLGLGTAANFSTQASAEDAQSTTKETSNKPRRGKRITANIAVRIHNQDNEGYFNAHPLKFLEAYASWKIQNEAMKAFMLPVISANPQLQKNLNKREEGLNQIEKLNFSKFSFSVEAPRTNEVRLEAAATITMPTEDISAADMDEVFEGFQANSEKMSRCLKEELDTRKGLPENRSQECHRLFRSYGVLNSSRFSTKEGEDPRKREGAKDADSTTIWFDDLNVRVEDVEIPANPQEEQPAA